MKRVLKYFVFAFLLLCPSMVFALSCSSKSIRGDGLVNFHHCMVSRCDDLNEKTGTYYVSTPTYTYTNVGVICNNGNDSPKVVKQVESDCPTIGSVCNAGEFKSCTVVIQYDCNKTSSGADYFTTTTTTTKKRTTTKKTTTKTITTPTTVQVSNTKLKSLVVADKNIDFSSDVYEYTVQIGSDINSLNITAIPEDSTSKVEISGNSNLVNNSIISVVVTGKDNKTSVYKIKVEKEVYIMSNNAKLKSLSVDGYNFSFNSKINEYSIIVDNGVSSLNINYETEDSKATVNITGNENLENDSRVVITVTAEDGTENKYILDITVRKKTNAFKYVFIVILILAILAGAYYIYKKFIASKVGDKYEYE